MDNLLQYIDEQRQCKDVQNTIDIQEILKQYPETSYLSDQTLESLQKEIIDSFRLYYPLELENNCISKLNEYRLIENICHLHKGKYIRWIRLNQEKPILTKAIKTIANENIKQIKNWKDKYPDCSVSDSRKNDLYLKIVSNSMNGLTKEKSEKNINKIIKNDAKEVTIEKT